jgi:hypothetical protein
MGWWAMVKRGDLSKGDLINFIIGGTASLLVGAALPGFCLFFGKMIDGVADTGADTNEFNALQKNSLYMIYIGCGLFFIGWA